MFDFVITNLLYIFIVMGVLLLSDILASAITDAFKK